MKSENTRWILEEQNIISPYLYSANPSVSFSLSLLSIVLQGIQDAFISKSCNSNSHIVFGINLLLSQGYILFNPKERKGRYDREAEEIAFLFLLLGL
jgi:hypothetical protein